MLKIVCISSTHPPISSTHPSTYYPSFHTPTHSPTDHPPIHPPIQQSTHSPTHLPIHLSSQPSTIHPSTHSPWLNARISFLILAFTPLSRYNPSISNPYDSINCKHLCTRMGMPPFVSCCSERGMPDTCVCFSAEIQVSASWGVSARRWNTLDSRCMNVQACVCVCVCGVCLCVCVVCVCLCVWCVCGVCVWYVCVVCVCV